MLYIIAATGVEDVNTSAFFGFMGVTCALVLASKRFYDYNSDIGAAYGTFKSGAGIAAIGIWKPEVIMKSLIPVVMAGILGIYGMIVAVLLS